MKYLLRTAALAAALLCTGLNWFSSGPASELDEFWTPVNAASDQKVDHQLWQQVLDDYLVEDPSGVNLIDYEGVNDGALEILDRYIHSLAAIDPRTLNRPQQMSYWINLYNALTVQLIARNYPVDSIKDLGESLFGSGPWDDELISIVDRQLTLNDIEHRILRPIFKDYRIHFVVNCASIGCPNIALDVFDADKLETQMEQAAKSFLQHPRGVEFRDGELFLSSLFKWYQGDFGNSEREMFMTLGRYVDDTTSEKLASFKGDPEYRYDWGLNGLD